MSQSLNTIHLPGPLLAKQFVTADRHHAVLMHWVNDGDSVSIYSVYQQVLVRQSIFLHKATQ